MKQLTSLIFLLTLASLSSAQEPAVQPVPATVQPAPATVQPAPATVQPVPATVQPAPATVQPAVQPAPEEPEDLVPCPDLKELQARFKRMHEIRLTLAPSGDVLPSDCSGPLFPTSSRGDALRPWAERQFHWVASEVSFQPLYFNETPLERYGQSFSPLLQPGLSGVHFFGNVLTLPYQIGVDGLYDRVYSLGYYRPGAPAPCVRQRLPWEMDAITLETAAILGIILLFP